MALMTGIAEMRQAFEAVTANGAAGLRDPETERRTARLEIG